MQIKLWTLAFDGSKHQKGVGPRVVITNLEGVEYKAFIIGLKLLKSLYANIVQIMGDS